MKMKQLFTLACIMLLMPAAAPAGSIDSPGAPGSGSGMPTLQELYEYLISGTPETVTGSFEEPAAGPTVGTMKTTKEIYDAIKAERDSDLTAGNIKKDVEIFGVTGTLEGGGLTCSGTLTGTRWCDQGNGTVMDMTTGLVWLKNANCIGTKKWADTSTNNDAVTWASILYDGSTAFSGGDCNLSDSSVQGDWRLPTLSELKVLKTGTEKVSSSTPGPFSNVQTFYYWSATTRADYPADAWSVELEYGGEGVVGKANARDVWPVR